MYWIKRLGLLDWEVRFKHGDKEGETKQFYANICTVQEPRFCVLRLCKTWEEGENSAELNTITLKKYALHEISHQLIAPLKCHATMRYTVEIEMDEAEHAIIQRLVNAFFEDGA